MTDPLGGSQVLPYLFGLADAGFTFTVVSAEKRARLAEHGPELAQRLRAAGFDWRPLLYHKKPPVLSTVWDLYAMYRVALLAPKPAFIHARSYPAALVARRLARKWKIPFIFDMRGFWIEERVEGGLWNLKNPLFNVVYSYFKRKERAFFQQASTIVSLTRRAVPTIQTLSAPAAPPIFIIPCCADIPYYAQPDSRRIEFFIEEFNFSDNDFVLGYLGSLGTLYLLDETLLFFAALLKRRPEARFLCITPDAPEIAFRAAEKAGVPAEKITVYAASREEIPALLALCTAFVYFIRPSFSKTASSPTKLGEILAAGKPVITHVGIGDVDELFDLYPIGATINDFSAAEFERALDELENALEFPPETFRLVAEKEFSLVEGVKRYRELYQLFLPKKESSETPHS